MLRLLDGIVIGTEFGFTSPVMSPVVSELVVPPAPMTPFLTTEVFGVTLAPISTSIVETTFGCTGWLF